MRVIGLKFVGIRTERFVEMDEFFGGVMGLSEASREHGMVIWRLPDGSLVEIFARGEADHLFFGDAPVVGLQVDDVASAREELERAGAEFVGPMQSLDGRGWSFFRAPDGNLYEITGPLSPAG
jgi:catechol 2,3-dioxygenase-like lactoylglutathione lyase family enzyme